MILRFLAIMLLLMGTSCFGKRPAEKVIVWEQHAPYSVDPLEYDASIHHIAFRPVLAPLVTQYRVGDYIGVIAESWSSSPDHRRWEFRIRKNVRFENGDQITPQVVAQSLKRMAFLMKQRNSQGGFAEILTEIDQLKTPSSIFKGIEATAESVVINLKTSSPKFLDVISFGLYSVTHLNDFDAVSGKWKDPKKAIASGHYRIAHWTDESLLLSLRKEFLPEVRHPQALEQIEIVHNPALRSGADIVSGNSLDTVPSLNHKFEGGALSGISYVMCRSWQQKDSPCFQVEERRKLRDVFYDEMSKRGAKITASFFPTVIPGVHVFPVEHNFSAPVAQAGHVRYRYSERASLYGHGFNQSVEVAAQRRGFTAERKNVSVETMMKEYEPNLPAYEADLYNLTTGILIEDPDADIRFMFLSKEGICLPDTDGKIIPELGKSKLDYSRINSLLWEQAVVWPVTHFSVGLWVKEGFDLGMVNLVLPPTDFSWIGRKP